MGGGLALLVFVPNLLWQMAHGWPTLEMMRSLRAENSGPGSALVLLAMQLVLVNPLLVPIWSAGLWWLLRSADGRPYRALAWAYLVVLVLLVAVGGKFYYPGAMYVVLLAAGAVAVERVLGRAGRRALVALVTGAGLLASPIALPIVPPEALGTVPVHELNPEHAESIGWPELVETVAAVYESLPPAERATAVIFTANYGEAGAVDLLGRPRGLPRAISGHNNYWLWGPPESGGGTVIAVGSRRERLEPLFGEVTLVARVDNPYGVDNEEQGAPVWLCRRPAASWAELWPRVKRYN
jgi:hypothetical protein